MRRRSSASRTISGARCSRSNPTRYYRSERLLRFRKYFGVHVDVLAVDAVPPLADAGIVADVERQAIAADEIDEIPGVRVVQIVRGRARDETHEVARADLVPRLSDVRYAAAGENVHPLLVLLMGVLYAARVSRLEANQMHAEARETGRVAERARVANERGIERVRPALFVERLHLCAAQQDRFRAHRSVTRARSA